VLSPNFFFICSKSPVSPPSECNWRGGVSTTGATPSGLAPGSDVKLSGDDVLPYKPQPIPMPNNTSTATMAALIPQPPAVGSRVGLRFGNCTGALAVCRSLTSACNSPRVAALVAEATRWRCSSPDS